MKWFRFYSEALLDRKVQELSPALFKHWVNLLCLACMSEDDGMLPDINDIAYILRIKPSDCEEVMGKLRAKGLIDCPSPARYRPHNWSERQRKSDTSAPRVARYRERQTAKQADAQEESNGNVTLHETLHVTPMKQAVTPLDKRRVEENREDTYTGNDSPQQPEPLPEVASATPARVKRSSSKSQQAQEPTTHPKNPIWDALVAEFYDPQTAPEKSKFGRAVKDLKAAHATPEQIHERCEWQRAMHDEGEMNWALTPPALVSNWTEIERRWKARKPNKPTREWVNKPPEPTRYGREASQVPSPFLRQQDTAEPRTA